MDIQKSLSISQAKFDNLHVMNSLPDLNANDVTFDLKNQGGHATENPHKTLEETPFRLRATQTS